MGYDGFDNLKTKLASESSVQNPGALAASIGRKKYGVNGFQKAAAKGVSMKNMQPKKPKTVQDLRDLAKSMGK